MSVVAHGWLRVSREVGGQLKEPKAGATEIRKIDRTMLNNQLGHQVVDLEGCFGWGAPQRLTSRTAP